jgi:hypothetical protein
LLNVILLNVILLNVILLNVILLNVILLYVILLNVILVNVILLNVILFIILYSQNFKIILWLGGSTGQYYKSFYGRKCCSCHPFPPYSNIWARLGANHYSGVMGLLL